MSTTAALWVLTWGVILFLFFALAAVMREVKLLRGQLETMGWQQVTPVAPDDIRLPAAFGSTEGRRLVLAATSGCPLCQMLAHELAERADEFAVRPALLTYEGGDAWSHLPVGLQIITDDDAWKQVAHLSPPVLLCVQPDGRVEDLAMPTTSNELEQTLAAWKLGAAHIAKEQS
ncbi:hypothetical protein ACTQ49_11120 [Luteococcus sp. Sow4_B9]|uniref:hypothetical protein n=1 Tax=Luteococcus sp. Sow4_B9 TaxID=3438792 RepID=UPI003F9B541B